LRFLIDTQLPRRLARLFREQGHPTDHVLDLDLAQRSDRLIAARARQTRACVVTKDEDFVQFAARGEISVLWIRLGNCPNYVLLAALTNALPRIVERLEQEEWLVEIR
jgi:predicted nuclease of predicted toxin-antitoxin system